MNPKELREKSVKLMRDAQALLLKPTVTAEDRAAFDKMIADADAAEADAVRMEAINKKIDDYTRGNPPPREQPGAGNQENQDAGKAAKEERGKFERFIRHGETYKETRDLGTVTGGAITAGAQFIPQAFYPVLTEAMKAWGQLIQAVTTRETDSGAPMKIPFANDTGNLAHVVGEIGPIPETDPLLSSQILSSDQLATDIVKVSLAELQDSAFDIDAFIRDQFGKRYYRGLTSLITNGSSSGNIQSIVSGATTGGTSAAGSAVAYGDIVALYAALDPAYVDTASWLMKSTTRAYLMGVTDTLGRPLFIPNPSSGAFDSLLGRPVVLDQYMDPIAPSTASPVYSGVALSFGDLKAGYLLRLVKPGLAIARLNERYIDTLEIGFIGYFRGGGIVMDAGTHPIVNLVQHT